MPLPELLDDGGGPAAREARRPARRERSIALLADETTERSVFLVRLPGMVSNCPSRLRLDETPAPERRLLGRLLLLLLLLELLSLLGRSLRLLVFVRDGAGAGAGAGTDAGVPMEARRRELLCGGGAATAKSFPKWSSKPLWLFGVLLFLSAPPLPSCTIAVKKSSSKSTIVDIVDAPLRAAQ